ncbi:hypothetical protein ACFOZ7_22260 [Natribaculum luteum]|uniref:Peptidase C39-like domain-containing protein n=1 Tax=Natribaculum luteum TaxID=1586232 RepID=A0ABD5P5P2_9EURY|nr:hypothetical protein [Natribaculum luteum]
MVGNPIMANPGGREYDVLRMPSHRQAQDAPECICYALWMVAHYVANEYPDKDVRAKTNPPKLDLIRDYLEIGDLGWENVGQEPLTELATEISSLKFHLEYRYNGLPQSVDEFANEGLNQLLPTIIMVDRVLLKTGNRGEGPVHAVIVSGVGDSHITIEDPLVEGTTTMEIGKLEEAWDPEFNTSIAVRLSDGLEPTRRDEL